MVDPDRLQSLVRGLASAIPADIQEAQEIIRQRESIVNQALLEARRTKETAGSEASSLVDAAEDERKARLAEHDIVKAAEERGEKIVQQGHHEAKQVVQEAQRKAYRILEEAEAVALAGREGSDRYAREILFDLEERLASQLGEVRRGIDVLGLHASTANGANGATAAAGEQATAG